MVIEIQSNMDTVIGIKVPLVMVLGIQSNIVMVLGIQSILGDGMRDSKLHNHGNSDPKCPW